MRKIWLEAAHLRRHGLTIMTSAAGVAQVWRGDPGQALLARMLRVADIHPVTDTTAREIGVLLGERRGSDIVDGHVALLARQHPDDVVATSDRDDLVNLGVQPARIVDV